MAGHMRLMDSSVHIVLYITWVLKNGSLGPAVSRQFLPFCNCMTLMKLLDDSLECSVQFVLN